jgi:hypothetical protein
MYMKKEKPMDKYLVQENVYMKDAPKESSENYDHGWYDPW